MPKKTAGVTTPLSRREVIGMLAASAALFRARSVLGQATETATPTVTPTAAPWQPPAGPLRDPLLSSLISDLLRKKGIRRRFNNDPASIVEAYDLTDAQKAVLYTMKRDDIYAAINTENQGWLAAFKNLQFTEVWDYEDEAPDPTNCDIPLFTSYPDPTPEIFRFRPREIAVGKPQTLVVYGQSFPPDATLALDPPADIAFDTKRIAGTFRSSRLFATVLASVAGADKYTVKIVRGGKDVAQFAKCKLSVK